MNIASIKRIIRKHHLNKYYNLQRYLIKNTNGFNIITLEQIAELANGKRQDNSAFYTDDFIVKKLISHIPKVNSTKIRVLEPAVGVGNFIIPFIKYMEPFYKKIDVDVNDIDGHSISILKIFIKLSHLSSKVKIHYFYYNFLSGLTFNDPKNKYDYVIGNPPFQRVSLKNSRSNGFPGVTNLAGQFLLKAISISRVVAMVMPKNLLSTRDYSKVRLILDRMRINKINDFGEHGFKGVLIETIGITITTDQRPSNTLINSMITKKTRTVNQHYITDPKYPSWLIYRNRFFDRVCSHMIFGIFKVFRDRQITNRIINKHGSIRVIKSRNIARDGTHLVNLPGYNAFIRKVYLPKLTVSKFLYNKSVYMVPNMTYYPRILRKKGNFIVNGSVAILIPKTNNLLTKTQINFINSKTFQDFYVIARNRSTRSLNIDKRSVFWFGKYIGDNK